MDDKFEQADLAPRIVGLWAYGLFAMALLLAFAVYLLWGLLQSMTARPPASPVEETRLIPPSPRLQTSPEDDLARLVARDRARLGGLGRLDGDRVHIPIDRAEQILVQRGWPQPSGGGR